jgi:hypothetical protein
MEKISDHTAQIQKALEDAEAAVREAGANAFRSGDDIAAGQARDIVAGLMALSLRLNRQMPDESPSDPVASLRQNVRSCGGKRKRSKARKGKQANYPRFEVRNNNLIRIGWSKKDKSEYQHKTPREIFDRTVEAMQKLAQSGPGPFMAEKIFENTNSEEGPVPSYQAYVVIGLLRDRQCVEQLGREGYMIPDDISSRALQVWEQLEGEFK